MVPPRVGSRDRVIYPRVGGYILRLIYHAYGEKFFGGTTPLIYYLFLIILYSGLYGTVYLYSLYLIDGVFVL